LPSTGWSLRSGAPSRPPGHKDVLALGADVARQLLRADLLDEVRIHLVPLRLGEGTPLFAGEQAELIAEGKPVAGTVTHLRFRVRDYGPGK
jgi:dihydrofolate reductase